MQTRRQYLGIAAGAGLVGVSGCNAAPIAKQDGPSAHNEELVEGGNAAEDEEEDRRCPVEKEPLDVRGAIYLPARAFNIYQMWEGYDPEIVERDFGYARRVNLNSIRAWVSYEFWREDPDAHEEAIDHFLAAAEDRDMTVLLGLFDHVGKEPTRTNLENTDPLTATAVSSPSEEVLSDRSRWTETREYVEWFMERYRDDDRLLAIEVMNEPNWDPRKLRFAEEMFGTMVDERGSVALTVGSTSMANNAEYMNWDIDALQFHYNFAQNQAVYRDMLRQHRVIADEVDQPVWLSEWQRVRSGRGFTSNPKPEEKLPNYASLAPVIHEAGFGNFFWSLMIKPAYVKSQRKNGILNGLFHEDGAVWSLDDARAIKAMSGDASYDGEERAEWPEWAQVVKKRANS